MNPILISHSQLTIRLADCLWTGERISDQLSLLFLRLGKSSTVLTDWD